MPSVMWLPTPGFPRPWRHRSWRESRRRGMARVSGTSSRQSFPTRGCWTDFVSGGARAIRAAGPGLTLHLGAGTVPGVTVTSMIRALLVKSAVLAKPGAGDVALTVRFARELQRIDARVGAAVAVQYWPGGAEDWDSWEREVLRAADQVVVYGSDATIESVRARAPASTRLVEHPHRVGVAVVDPGRAPGAAAEAARAAVLFDQRGCVSTQLVFVLGDRRAVRRWCASLANELVAHWKRCCLHGRPDLRICRRCTSSGGGCG